MVRLIVLYKHPSDPKAFDEHYFKIHKPLAEKIPGLRRYLCGKVVDAPFGKAQYHLAAELHFDDMAAFGKGMSSPEGKAAAKDVSNFAPGDLVSMHLAQEV